jgi:hypothetical protein
MRVPQIFGTLFEVLFALKGPWVVPGPVKNKMFMRKVNA